MYTNITFIWKMPANCSDKIIVMCHTKVEQEWVVFCAGNNRVYLTTPITLSHVPDFLFVYVF